ncbi:MAG: hypothetical protein JWR37_5085 [Mycobacterium sp.]|nr:hypothetical protein [Mycobacterium sp.]
MYTEPLIEVPRRRLAHQEVLPFIGTDWRSVSRIISRSEHPFVNDTTNG